MSYMDNKSGRKDRRFDPGVENERADARRDSIIICLARPKFHAQRRGAGNKQDGAVGALYIY